MIGICERCGQPLPSSERRDPPLPPLDFPTLVTIHDLPKGARPEVDVEPFDGGIGPTALRRLKPESLLPLSSAGRVDP